MFNLWIDPVSLLPISAPALLWLPAVGLLMLLAGVRTRRGSFWFSLVMAMLTALDLAMVAWARITQTAPFQASYSWINVTVAFSGDSRWQTFNPALALRITHSSLDFLAILLLLFLTAVWWHRFNGLRGSSAIRFYGPLFLLWVAATGVVIGADLLLTAAFWLLAGVGGFLLISHQWGSDQASRRARLVLAFPLLGDLSLLAGVALIYSRFATTNLDQLAVLIGHTPGVGVKSMWAIAALLGFAIVVRGGLWPFHRWQTRIVGSPTAAVSAVVGSWPLLVGMLAMASRPFFTAPGMELWISLAVGIVVILGLVGLLLSMLSSDLRWGLVLASSTVVVGVAMAIAGGRLQNQALGLTILAVLAMSRSLAVIAAGHLALANETADLRFLGDGWRRMPRTVVTLAVATVGITFPLVLLFPACPSLISKVILGIALLLLGGVLGRLWGAVAFNQLPYRRAFTPSRIRDVGKVSTAILIIAGLGVVVSAVLAGIPAWIGWLNPAIGRVQLGVSELLWLVLPLLGAAVGVGFLRKGAPLVLSISGGEVFKRPIAPFSNMGHYLEGLLNGLRSWEERILPRLQAELGDHLIAVGRIVIAMVKAR